MGHSTTKIVLSVVLPALLILPVFLFSTTGALGPVGLTPAATVASGGPAHFPPAIAPEIAWDGIGYNKTCAACLLADAQVASAPGYVFEMV
ncbi:MAG: hypothetical protein WA549_03400, partial [Thermoplasmata archaeon]